MDIEFCGECTRLCYGRCSAVTTDDEKFSEVKDVPIHKCKKLVKMTRVCKEHGEYEAYVSYMFGVSSETTCPECEKARQQKELIEASKVKAQDAIKNLSAMRIREKYHQATLDSCTAETESQKTALNLIRRMTQVKRGTIVILGGNGVGKTYFATAALQAIGGRYYTMFEISCIIRSTYSPASKMTEFDFLEILCELPLLVIDEFGRSKISEAELNWLSYIIDRRKSENKPTIIISNARATPTVCLCNSREGRENPCSSCRKICFSSMIGSDIISRLNEESAVIEIDGRDRRIRINKAG